MLTVCILHISFCKHGEPRARHVFRTVDCSVWWSSHSNINENDRTETSDLNFRTCRENVAAVTPPLRDSTPQRPRPSETCPSDRSQRTSWRRVCRLRPLFFSHRLKSSLGLFSGPSVPAGFQGLCSRAPVFRWIRRWESLCWGGGSVEDDKVKVSRETDRLQWDRETMDTAGLTWWSWTWSKTLFNVSSTLIWGKSFVLCFRVKNLFHFKTMNPFLLRVRW